MGSVPDAKSISNLKSTLVTGNEKSFELKKIVKAVSRKIVQAKSLFKPNILNKNEPKVIPSFIICGGEKANKSYSGFSNVNIDVIKTHALDYDRYLEEESKNEDVNIESNYAILSSSPRSMRELHGTPITQKKLWAGQFELHCATRSEFFVWWTRGVD